MVLVEKLGILFVVEDHVCCFHGIYRNTPFRMPGLEINDSYLYLNKTQHHQHIWIPMVQRGLGENCGSSKELPPRLFQEIFNTDVVKCMRK